MMHIAAKVTNSDGRTYIYWSDTGYNGTDKTWSPFAGKVEIAPTPERAMERVREVMGFKDHAVVAVLIDDVRMPQAELAYMRIDTVPALQAHKDTLLEGWPESTDRLHWLIWSPVEQITGYATEGKTDAR